jgi:hypothetical protein
VIVEYRIVILALSTAVYKLNRQNYQSVHKFFGKTIDKPGEKGRINLALRNKEC